MVYKRLIDLQYICVREATEKQCGILVRVLGKTKAESIMFVSGQPFCNDDEFLLFEGQVFSSYSFPTVGELTEVLDIIHSNPSLFSQFEAASMPFDPNSLFWVRETAISLPFTKKPRCYDASTNRLCKAPKDSEPYRLTMAYFNTKQELVEPDIVEKPIVEKPAVEKPNVEKPESKSRMRGVMLFICVVILLVGAFLAGKYVNSPNADNSGNIEQDSVKKPVVDSKQDSVKKPVVDSKQDSVKKSAVDSKQDSVKKSAAEEIVSSEKNDATPQKKDTISQPEKKDTLLTTDQYEAMDNRVRTGAYRIIGTDRIVTVKPNDNMTRISNRTLGPGMECYIEVYNGIKPGTPLEPGQKIKIPKVESKKKKPKTK